MRRLTKVFRALAHVVAVAMLLTSGSTPLHVHASSDHEGAEHHLAPASHAHAPDGHADERDATPDDVARLAKCDPGEDAVFVVFTCIAPQDELAPTPRAFEMADVVSPQQVERRVTPSDVHAHSPPRITDAPLRAPPPVIPA